MKKEHWDSIYSSKSLNDLSWTEEIPTISLEMIDVLNLDKSSSIIDVGGGRSNLIAHLLDEGFTNLTVLDISEVAINQAKNALGEKAKNVNWIVADVLDYQFNVRYDVWHDRACFHFLENENDIEKYKSLINEFVESNLLLGTFSTDGPEKCSGLSIKQYDVDSLSEVFKENFDLYNYFSRDHKTPKGAIQNFLFCTFKRKVSI